MPPRPHYVYCLAVGPDGAFDVGVTEDLDGLRRACRGGRRARLAGRAEAVRLVYLEAYPGPHPAALRARRLARWPWAWQHALVREHNPLFRDLWTAAAGAVGG